MIDVYTTTASELVDALVETDIAKIWSDIELLGDEADSEKWGAKLKKIAKGYLISSRFALMRILCNRAVSHSRNNQNQAEDHRANRIAHRGQPEAERTQPFERCGPELQTVRQHLKDLDGDHQIKDLFDAPLQRGIGVQKDQHEDDARACRIVDRQIIVCHKNL